MWIGRGTNLFHAFGNVPPSVPMEPESALSRKRQRATCHPPRLPAVALRHVCVLRRLPAEATIPAICSIVAAATPDSASAKANVYGA